MSNNSSTYKKVLSKGIQNNLPDIENGKLRFTTDTGRLFLDDNGKRIEITDFVKDKTKDEILNIEYPLPKIYLASDTLELYCYDNGEWKAISGQSEDTKVTQTPISNETGTYRLLMSATGDDTTRTEESRKSSKALFDASKSAFTFGSRTNGSTVGTSSVVEGLNCVASGYASHAEGWYTTSKGTATHAEGYKTSSNRSASHAEGDSTIAEGDYSHAEGNLTQATGSCSHAEGQSTKASGKGAHAEGLYNTAIGIASHVEGGYSTSSGQKSNLASGNNSHAEGLATTASGYCSHVEGEENIASGTNSHAEGNITTASGDYGSHAEGHDNIASGPASHAEGQQTTASADYSHSEGTETKALGIASHAEGHETAALGSHSHAEGYCSCALAEGSHAEGCETEADGIDSHAEGYATCAYGDCSHAEGENTIASAPHSHAEGYGTTASGDYSHAEGYYVVASGKYSHAEGSNTNATGYYSHAEGSNTNATGIGSHAEGVYSTSYSDYSHAEGLDNIAFGYCSHAEGYYTTASGDYSHVEGNNTEASGWASHAEGYETYAGGEASHAEGYDTEASGWASHAEGYETEASGGYSHTEGYVTIAEGDYSHAEGQETTASGDNSHTEGYVTIAEGDYSHAEGYNTIAGWIYSHAEGYCTTAANEATHAEGYETEASGEYSHTEGSHTLASGDSAHAEGSYTCASGNYSAHAEGTYTTASGNYSHAEGESTLASADSTHAEGSFTEAIQSGAHAEGVSTKSTACSSHSEGDYTTASGDSAHAEGSYTCASGSNAHTEGQNTSAASYNSHAEGSYTYAYGEISHVEGEYTISNHKNQHVFGRYNIEDPHPGSISEEGYYVEIVGNGDDSTSGRSNARTLDWNGNEWLSGSLRVGNVSSTPYDNTMVNGNGVTVMRLNENEDIESLLISSYDLTLSNSTWDGTNARLKDAIAAISGGGGNNILKGLSAPTSDQGVDGDLYVKLRPLDPYLDNFVINYDEGYPQWVDTGLDISNLHECKLYIKMYQMVADVETLVYEYEEQVDFQNFSTPHTIYADATPVGSLYLSSSAGQPESYLCVEKDRPDQVQEKWIMTVIDATATANAIDTIYIKDNGEWLADNDSTIPSPTSEDVDKVLGATDVGEYGWVDSIRFFDSGASAEVYTDHISVSQAGYGGSSMTRDEIQISNIMGSSIKMTSDDITLGSTWDGTNTGLKDAIAAASGFEAVYKTLAEYEALPTADKEDPTKIYFVINEGSKVSPTLSSNDGNCSASYVTGYEWRPLSGDVNTELSLVNGGLVPGENCWWCYHFDTRKQFSKVNFSVIDQGIGLRCYIQASNDGSIWVNILNNPSGYEEIASRVKTKYEFPLNTNGVNYEYFRIYFYRTTEAGGVILAGDTEIYAAETSSRPLIYYKNVLYTEYELPNVTISDTGKVLIVDEDGVWNKGDVREVPEIHLGDDEKVLTVESGQSVWSSPKKVTHLYDEIPINNPLYFLGNIDPSTSPLTIDMTQITTNYEELRSTDFEFVFMGGESNLINRPWGYTSIDSAPGTFSYNPATGELTATLYGGFNSVTSIGIIYKKAIIQLNENAVITGRSETIDCSDVPNADILTVADFGIVLTNVNEIYTSNPGTLQIAASMSYDQTTKQLSWSVNETPWEHLKASGYVVVGNYGDPEYRLITNFVGATSNTDGYRGYIPTPLAGDENKVLKGNGTWNPVYRELTQAEYDALPSSKNSDGIIYFITDNS